MFSRTTKNSGREYVSALLELELHGVDGKWPVRYCSDMLLSGHTFATCLAHDACLRYIVADIRVGAVDRYFCLAFG